MLGYLLLFAGVFTSLAEGVLIKQYNKKSDKGGFLFTALVSLFSMVFFLGKDLITDPSGLTFLPKMLPYAIVAGLLYCVASLLTYVALQIGSFAITLLILSYGMVFSVGYGILFLHESATLSTWIALLAIAVSLFLVRGKKEEGEGKRFSLLWLVCVLISFVGSGLFSVVQRMQQIRFDDSCTNEFMVIALLLSSVVLLIAGFIKDGKDCLYILKNGSPYAIGAGLSNGATNLLSLVVNTMLPLSIAFPSRAILKNAISFAFSYFVFREKFLPRQIAGIVIGVLAVLLLNG